MIELRDFDVYATDEGLFIVGDSDTATRVASPSTAHGLSEELREAWEDVSGNAGGLARPSSKRRSTSRTGASESKRRSKGSGDYDPTEKQCQDCNSTNVSLSEGCITCMECGWSKC